MVRELGIMVANLLHYMKGCHGDFRKDFKNVFRNSKAWCCFTHEDIGFDLNCYLQLENSKYVINISNKILLIYDLLGIHPQHLRQLENSFSLFKNPIHVTNYQDFKEIVDEIKGWIDEFDEEVRPELEKLSCIECIRLDEALDCYQNNSYMSSVVMSVSAVESRLHEYINYQNPSLYKSEFEKATLGQIIKFFKEKPKNKDKIQIQKELPKKYLPLVELLNQYRVFSAHPKNELIENRGAR